MHRNFIDIKHNTIIDYIKEVFTSSIQVDLCIKPNGNFERIASDVLFNTEERIVLNEHTVSSGACVVGFKKFNNRYMEML